MFIGTGLAIKKVSYHKESIRPSMLKYHRLRIFVLKIFLLWKISLYLSFVAGDPFCIIMFV